MIFQDSLAAPEWYRAALAAEPNLLSATVDGASIRARSWGLPNLPAVILVHGGAAHSRWWDHIAPLLATRRRVIAVDLSGHGESDHRDEYSIAQWSREVVAIAAANSAEGLPILIGHSLGGVVVVSAALSTGSAIGGAIIIDSPLSTSSPEDREASGRHVFGAHRIYPDRDSILRRFRPIPEQPTIPWITAHVAETSIKEVDTGWTWKFDRKIFERRDTLPQLVPLICRAAFIRGEVGLVTPEMEASIGEGLGPSVPVIEIPDSNHHLMLDAPLSLVSALRAVIAEWETAEMR